MKGMSTEKGTRTPESTADKRLAARYRAKKFREKKVSLGHRNPGPGSPTRLEETRLCAEVRTRENAHPLLQAVQLLAPRLLPEIVILDEEIARLVEGGEIVHHSLVLVDVSSFLLLCFT